MDAIATKLVQPDICGQDLKAQNPLVLQALTGLQNYYLYYGAGCLKDDVTNIYCMFLVMAFLIQVMLSRYQILRILPMQLLFISPPYL